MPAGRLLEAVMLDDPVKGCNGDAGDSFYDLHGDLCGLSLAL
jgi:hypothetical protein